MDFCVEQLYFHKSPIHLGRTRDIVIPDLIGWWDVLRSNATLLKGLHCYTDGDYRVGEFVFLFAVQVNLEEQ